MSVSTAHAETIRSSGQLWRTRLSFGFPCQRPTSSACPRLATTLALRTLTRRRRKGRMATPRVDRRLRIAFVVSTLEVGGLQRAIATIARNLDRDRGEMEVIAMRRPPGASSVMYEQL